MLENGQTYVKNFKNVWPFFNIMYERIKQSRTNFVFCSKFCRKQTILPISA